MTSIILGMGFGLCLPGHAQMGGVGGGIGGGGGGMPTIPRIEFDEVTDARSIQVIEGLHVLPSVQVSERYDSNVFYASKDLLQGVNPEDFVTTVMPQIRGLYADHQKLVNVNAVAGVHGSHYVNNTGLDYVGGNGGVVLDMSDLLSRWRPGARWTISDMFFYSPQPPAFLIGELGQQINPLVAGFQARRTNTSGNSVNAVLQFPINRTLSVSSSYTNSFINYGESLVQGGPPLISRSLHGYSAGLLMQVSLLDTVRVDFTGSEFDLGERGAFSARGANLAWIHQFSPAVSVNVTGGVRVLSGVLNGVPLSSRVAPFGRLALLWQDPSTSIALTYQSGITASVHLQGAAMLNHMVSLHMTQNTPIRGLSGLLAVNYGVANDYGGSNLGGSLSWTTVRGTAGLLYQVTQKTFLSLNYSYLDVDNVVGTRQFAFDKHIVQLSLSQVFY